MKVYLNAANLITFLSIAFSIGAIESALSQNYILATNFFILAGVADMMDGLVARKLKRTKDEELFGKNLDSLADVVAFCVTPVMYWYAFFQKDGAIGTTMIIIYVICGVYRLAYFNVHELKEVAGKKYYTGLPVTFAALIFPTLVVIMNVVNFEKLHSYFYHLPILLTAILFVSGIKIRKPSGKAYIIFGVLAISMIIVNSFQWK